jgi:hypothetical protein
MRHGASFGHVYQIASHCQAGGDDVIELPEHGDLTVERNVQHSSLLHNNDVEKINKIFR